MNYMCSCCCCCKRKEDSDSDSAHEDDKQYFIIQDGSDLGYEDNSLNKNKCTTSEENTRRIRKTLPDNTHLTNKLMRIDKDLIPGSSAHTETTTLDDSHQLDPPSDHARPRRDGISISPTVISSSNDDTLLFNSLPSLSEYSVDGLDAVPLPDRKAVMRSNSSSTHQTCNTGELHSDYISPLQYPSPFTDLPATHIVVNKKSPSESQVTQHGMRAPIAVYNSQTRQHQSETIDSDGVINPAKKKPLQSEVSGLLQIDANLTLVSESLAALRDKDCSAPLNDDSASVARFKYLDSGKSPQLHQIYDDSMLSSTPNRFQNTKSMLSPDLSINTSSIASPDTIYSSASTVYESTDSIL